MPQLFSESHLRKCYAHLDIPPGSTPEAVKQAFRRGAKRLHPDVNPSQGAQHAFRSLHEAFETIKESQERSLGSGLKNDGPGLTVLTVSKKLRGVYSTIGEAIRESAPGATIHVKPGIYRVGVVLNREVRIVGDGPREKIIIASRISHCVTMDVHRAEICGVTLRGLSNRKGERFFAVAVPRGKLTLERCDIHSDALSGVVSHGMEAHPVIRACRIHDCGQAGLYFYDGAGGIVEGSVILGSHGPGIQIEEGANPLVQGCQINNGLAEGVYVKGDGQGILENCDILNNAGTALRMEKSGGMVRRGLNTIT